MAEDPRAKGRAGSVLDAFREGAELAQELLAENARLTSQIENLRNQQPEAEDGSAEWEKTRAELATRISALEDENASILEQLRTVEGENQQFAERYVEIEEENNNLANLYVASYQLHSTLDPGEVLKVILEIVINLIGAEVFCVYVYDEKTGVLEPVASEGQRVTAFPKVKLGAGFVGESVSSGGVATRTPGETTRSPEGALPVVSIPLRVCDRPVGAIAIYTLLQQKDGFSSLDHELFTLLAGHAATAIFASDLYSQSERKLSTIQGFIDLLTQ